jgi:hypothetical protein
MNSFLSDIGYFRKHSSSLHFSQGFEKDGRFCYDRHGEIMDLE